MKYGSQTRAFYLAIAAATASSVDPGDVAASLIVDVRATAVIGTGAVLNAKSATAAPGSIVRFDVFARTTGADGNPDNDGLLIVGGSFLSTASTPIGNLAATVDPGFRATGSSNGRIVDLDSDGDLDVGSNTNASLMGFFIARSNTAPTPTYGTEHLIGTLHLTVLTSDPAAASEVNFRPRATVTGASWYEDGMQITSAQFAAGPPVTVAPIPEVNTLAAGSTLCSPLLVRARSRWSRNGGHDRTRQGGARRSGPARDSHLRTPPSAKPNALKHASARVP